MREVRLPEVVLRGVVQDAWYLNVASKKASTLASPIEDLFVVNQPPAGGWQVTPPPEHGDLDHE